MHFISVFRGIYPLSHYSIVVLTVHTLDRYSILLFCGHLVLSDLSLLYLLGFRIVQYCLVCCDIVALTVDAADRFDVLFFSNHFVLSDLSLLYCLDYGDAQFCFTNTSIQITYPSLAFTLFPGSYIVSPQSSICPF